MCTVIWWQWSWHQWVHGSTGPYGYIAEYSVRFIKWKEREKTDNNPLYWSFYESHNYGTTLLLYPGKRGSVTHQYMDWLPVVAFSKCWLPDLINLILYKFYARCKAGSLAKHWKIIHPGANLKMYSGINPHSVAYIYAWLQWPWIIWALHAVIIDVNDAILIIIARCREWMLVAWKLHGSLAFCFSLCFS